MLRAVMHKVLRSLTFLLLAGCASSPSMNSADWTNPSKDNADWKLDLAECERFFSATDGDKVRCMSNKGWRPRKK
jgi:hypothetical protein